MKNIYRQYFSPSLENQDEYDVKLLKQQTSSEETSESELQNRSKLRTEDAVKFDSSADDSDDDNGMTMKV